MMASRDCIWSAAVIGGVSDWAPNCFNGGSGVVSSTCCSSNTFLDFWLVGDGVDSGDTLCVWSSDSGNGTVFSAFVRTKRAAHGFKSNLVVVLLVPPALRSELLLLPLRSLVVVDRVTVVQSSSKSSPTNPISSFLIEISYFLIIGSSYRSLDRLAPCFDSNKETSMRFFSSMCSTINFGGPPLPCSSWKQQSPADKSSSMP
mmetsp:Transcript_45467/g.110133  ORF Transcript_45467/g.110133 Transcript_45467/m.110133 type:complete len:202 (-) Transcript_45467:275-880(-)